MKFFILSSLFCLSSIANATSFAEYNYGAAILNCEFNVTIKKALSMSPYDIVLAREYDNNVVIANEYTCDNAAIETGSNAYTCIHSQSNDIVLTMNGTLNGTFFDLELDLVNTREDRTLAYIATGCLFIPPNK